jgi:hypothetical protein
MLLPQFSLRRALWIITACACFFLVQSLAMRGHAWALGVTVASASLLVAHLFYALFFVLVTFVGQLIGTESISARTSRGSIVSGTDPRIPLHGAAHQSSHDQTTPSTDSLP